MFHEYQIVRSIGEGAFGKVYLVRKTEQHQCKLYAMKKIPFHKMQFDVESEILPTLCHPNIISTKDVIVDNKDTFLILEYADGGDLSEYVKSHFHQPIDTKTITSWFVQLCLGLHYLHEELRIIHRDIKTTNVLVMENALLKLADFGVSRKLETGEEFAATSVGTPECLSPEVINLGKYDSKTDVWGLGCIMFQLCTGVKPFKAAVLNELIKNIMNNDCGEISSMYPKWMRDLIKSMLEKNPNNRPSIQDILERPQLKEEFYRLKQKYKEYKNTIYPIRSIRTTKHYQVDDRMLKLFTQSLKTAKNQKSIRIGIEPQTTMKKQQPTNKKVQREKYLNRSLQSIIAKRKQQKLENSQ